MISYPTINKYDDVFRYFLENTLKQRISPPLPKTDRTIYLGKTYSPKLSSKSFQNRLGSMIESCEIGTLVLFQIEGIEHNCYSELQEEILKDLGFNVKVYSLINDKFDVNKVVKIFKTINKKINAPRIYYFILMSYLMIKYLDKLKNFNSDYYMEFEKHIMSSMFEAKNPIKLCLLYISNKKKLK